VAAGFDPDDFGERLSFFFNAHNDFLQEVAKFRAARRLWAGIMESRFGVTNPKALALRFHAQTGGSTLTAQQPEVNVVPVASQALSAVLGGCQSLHTNGFDEALALPSERAATLALRTQQVIAHESGVVSTADPLGGSYYVEALTRELEKRVLETMGEMTGAAGGRGDRGRLGPGEIEAAAYEWTTAVETGARKIVGVNAFVDETGSERIELQRLDPVSERRQVERTIAVRAAREAAAATAALEGVRGAARGSENMLPPIRTALAAHCTVGEVCGVLREEWGSYR
jgi:methylmalonyl-CoA mutase N-terminal domain/subunit